MSELRQRRPRQRNHQYLAWLRKQPCACGCGQAAPSDAAHIRSGSIKYEKPYTGMAEKPDDRWALPLKHAHHMAQHDHGDELGFWAAHGVRDVFRLALLFNARYFQETGRLADEPVSRRSTKPRPRPKRSPRATATRPAAKRKIAGRSTWPKGRKIQNRGFQK